MNRHATLNRFYRLVWNDRLAAYVAVAETTKGRGKRSVRAGALAAVFMAAMGLCAPYARAGPPNPPAPTQLPTGAQVTAGSASINQSGTHLDVNQSSNRAVINWNTFNVGSQAQVNYNQPSSSSATLNRVLDSNPSQILGKITANGQVYFVNPNGVYFGKSASVDVGALVASTHSIKDADFMAGKLKFSRDGSTGSVVNEGEIRAALNGFVALLAPEVRNEGVIVAQLGTVALASGEAVSLQFDGEGRLHNVTVEPSQIKALVENKGAVLAPGGLIILSARAVDRLQGGVVKNSGRLEATGMQMRGGKIVLEGGSSGVVENSGTLDASSAEGQGGRIVVTGEQVLIKSGSHLTASGATGGGEVLVGGDWQGSGGLYQATTVTMEQGASIDVSATKVGSGGTAVLWSDVGSPLSVTRAYGSVEAKGGPNGGDGGRIETSGHVVDTSEITVNAGATRGKGGLWLIDPADSTVTQAIANGYVTTLNPPVPE